MVQKEPKKDQIKIDENLYVKLQYAEQQVIVLCDLVGTLNEKLSEAGVNIELKEAIIFEWVVKQLHGQN